MPVEKYFKGSGKEVMKDMKERYGSDKGKSVFYATANKQNMNPPSYKKGGVVPEDGTIKAHKGEIVLPSRGMEPPTPADNEMSGAAMADGANGQNSARARPNQKQGGQRAALQGRGFGNIPQLTGVSQIVGLALGSPEFQRH